MRVVKLPTNPKVINELRVGEVIYLSGLVVTMRDLGKVRYLRMVREGKGLPINIRCWGVFHAGPIVKLRGGKYVIKSIGPTTSARMDHLVAELIKAVGPVLFIGKGGLGELSRDAFRRFGGAYVELVGGTASLITKAVKEVVNVYWLDLGVPEALWVLRVDGLGPAIVTMDSRGNYLRDGVIRRAYEVIKELIRS